MNESEQLTARQFQDSRGVEDWRVLAFGASTWFDAPSHSAGAALVRSVAALADAAGHRPDIDLRATGVHIRTVTPAAAWALTEPDVMLARGISAAARDHGLSADPSAVQALQLTIDTLDKPSVMPFWRAALGYEPMGDDDLVDAVRRDPAIWFQPMDVARPLRNRVHLDVGVPPDRAHERVAAVKAAGGREAFAADYYVTLADAEGNEVDVVPLAPESDLAESPETADWRVLFGAMTYYPTATYGQAAQFAAAVAQLADDAEMALLVDLRAGGVTIDTGKDQWVDERFGDLARQVQAAARGMGLTADPSRLRFVQIGIDAVDIPAVRSFWRAVLGYEFDERPDITDIYDPRRLNPPLFFQRLSADDEARRQQRNRIHVDLFVPNDQADARIDAALAHGGRVVYDAEAPEWWTLADPEGNEVDIAVSVGREEIWLAAQQASSQPRPDRFA
jgi:pterin-4a-carbinolamine dehydratase/predicted enzyme related to lactoylglutathione lyase